MFDAIARPATLLGLLLVTCLAGLATPAGAVRIGPARHGQPDPGRPGNVRHIDIVASGPGPELSLAIFCTAILVAVGVFVATRPRRHPGRRARAVTAGYVRSSHG